MKKALIIFLISFFFSTQSFAETIDFNSAEDQLHLAAGFAVNLTAYSILRETTDLSRNKCLLFSTVGTIVLAAAKESFLDSKFSSSKFKSASIGAVGAVVIPFVFEF